MKGAPTGFQWAGVVATTAVLTALISNPGTLPPTAENAVRQATDGVTRAILWAWQEPADLLDRLEEPEAEVDPLEKPGRMPADQPEMPIQLSRVDANHMWGGFRDWTRHGQRHHVCQQLQHMDFQVKAGRNTGQLQF